MFYFYFFHENGVARRIGSCKLRAEGKVAASSFRLRKVTNSWHTSLCVRYACLFVVPRTRQLGYVVVDRSIPFLKNAQVLIFRPSSETFEISQPSLTSRASLTNFLRMSLPAIQSISPRFQNHVLYLVWSDVGSKDKLPFILKDLEETTYEVSFKVANFGW